MFWTFNNEYHSLSENKTRSISGVWEDVIEDFVLKAGWIVGWVHYWLANRNASEMWNSYTFNGAARSLHILYRSTYPLNIWSLVASCNCNCKFRFLLCQEKDEDIHWNHACKHRHRNLTQPNSRTCIIGLRAPPPPPHDPPKTTFL